MIILPKKKTIYAFRSERLPAVFSPSLQRNVLVDIYLPPNFGFAKRKYPFLILNDGQDSELLRLKTTLSHSVRHKQIAELIVIAIHCEDRMQEYGISSQSDFKGRGSKAAAYQNFVINELLPLLSTPLKLDFESEINAIAGYSLGGLSAFDIAWQHPEIFHRVGVFSGSLWWRTKSYAEGYSDDKHRIVHQMVRGDLKRPGLQFWFETGTQDETNDRNGNGIIDSIDDTLDLISELVKKGYRPFHDIQYLEIRNGKHNLQTWAVALPYFLKWAFGNSTGELNLR